MVTLLIAGTSQRDNQQPRLINISKVQRLSKGYNKNNRVEYRNGNGRHTIV